MLRITQHYSHTPYAGTSCLFTPRRSLQHLDITHFKSTFAQPSRGHLHPWSWLQKAGVFTELKIKICNKTCWTLTAAQLFCWGASFSVCVSQLCLGRLSPLFVSLPVFLEHCSLVLWRQQSESLLRNGPLEHSPPKVLIPLLGCLEYQ